MLGAVYLGVRALAEPSRRLQLGFAALAVLATFARIQYVFLPLVFVAAALVVERGSVRAVWSRFRLSVLLYAAPLAFAAVLGPKRLLGYYSGVADLHVRPGEIAHWLGTDAMLLAYAAGFALVPGAIVGIALALWKPSSREESRLRSALVGLLLGLFAETALYATNGSDRFQERYLMVLLPLVFPAFVLWLRRGRPAKHAVALIAVGLLALSARVPLSGYTVSDFKQDSPFLMGVFRLEKAVGVGDGSLSIALGAAVLAGLGAAVAFKSRLVWLAVGATIVASCAVSLGAVSFDHHVVRSVRATYLPPDARWIDHAHVGDATLIQTPATPHARAHEQLFWNSSLKRLAFLDQASPIDAFGHPHVTIADDGRFLLGGKTLRGPLVISNFAVRAQLTGAVRVATRSGLRALAPGRHAADGAVRRRPLPERLALPVRPRDALPGRQRPCPGDATPPTLPAACDPANRAAPQGPGRRPPRHRRPRQEHRRERAGLAPRPVDAELALRPHRLPAAG